MSTIPRTLAGALRLRDDLLRDSCDENTQLKEKVRELTRDNAIAEATIKFLEARLEKATRQLKAYDRA